MIHSLWNLRTVISDALHRPHNRPLCSSFSPASPTPPLSPPPLFFLCNPRVKHDFQECRGTIIAQHVEIIQLQVSENFPSAREKKERTWSLLFTLISQPCTVRSPAKFHVSRRILLSEGSNVLGEMVGFRIGGARPPGVHAIHQADARWLPIQFAPSERKRVGKSIHRAWNDWRRCS